MEQIIANLAGQVRRATLSGRPYLVAPITLIVPGVLNGSQGALFYPQEEIARSADSWNHVPIVVRHPTSADGRHVSARTADVLNAQGIGVILNATSNGKLAAEAWFDEAALKRFDPVLFGKVEQGQAVEISTGLFTDNEPAPQGAAFNGTAYSHIARNYRPDHLAILPDSAGACSVADGCGLNVNESDKRTLWQRLGELLGVNAAKAMDGEEMSAAMFAYVPDPSKPSTWKLRIDDAGHVGGAIAAIGKGFRGQKVDIPAADLPAVKRKIRAAWLKFHKDKSEGDLPAVLRNAKGEDMTKLTDQDRKAIVDDLIANACCYEEEDREVLNELSDNNLGRLKGQHEKDRQREAVVNAAKKGFTDPGGNTHTWNEKDQKWDTKPKEPVANTGGDGEQTAEPKTADEWLKNAPAEVQSAVRNAMSIERAEKQKLAERLTANVKDDAVKAKQIERLIVRPLEDLRADAELLPPEPHESVLNYAGAVGANRGSGPRLTPMGLPGEYLDLEESA